MSQAGKFEIMKHTLQVFSAFPKENISSCPGDQDYLCIAFPSSPFYFSYSNYTCAPGLLSTVNYCLQICDSHFALA